MTADLLERCRDPFEAALKDAGLNASDIDEVVLVGGATRMPVVQDLVRKLINKEPNKSVNPDEVVAVGAAIQAGVLGRRGEGCAAAGRDPALAGRRNHGRRDDPRDRAQHHHPGRARSQVFSTAEDSQTAVDIHVLQGERPMAADNMSLGRFRLEGIPAAARHAAGRSDLRHRRQRHPQCVGA